MAFSTRVAVVGGIVMVARGQKAQRKTETADAMGLERAMSKREVEDMGGGLAEGDGHRAERMAHGRGGGQRTCGTGRHYVGGNLGFHRTGNGKADLANPKMERWTELDEVDPVGGVVCADLRGARGGHDVGHGSRGQGELGGQGNVECVVG